MSWRNEHVAETDLRNLGVIHEFAGFLRDHLPSIAVGLVATILVIYGNSLNRFFRRQTRSMHFIARFTLFVLLCSAGYGFLSSQAVKLLKNLMMGLSDFHLVLAVIGSFVLLGYLARAGKEV